jgi:hypothetical protein
MLSLILLLNFTACSKLQNIFTSSSKKVSYTALDSVSFEFPSDWKNRSKDTDAAYELFCISKDSLATTGVFLFDSNDIDESFSTLSFFNSQIDDMMSKVKKVKLVAAKDAKRTQDKIIIQVLYTGVYGFRKYKYLFSLIEFAGSDEFAICVQICPPSRFERYEPILEEILDSAKLVR